MCVDKHALSDSGEDLGSNSYCCTCQSRDSVLYVVCVPREQGRVSNQGKAQQALEVAGQTLHSCTGLRSAQAISPTW